MTGIDSQKEIMNMLSFFNKILYINKIRLNYCDCLLADSVNRIRVLHNRSSKKSRFGKEKLVIFITLGQMIGEKAINPTEYRQRDQVQKPASF
jgi:hypothetical protein